MIDVIDLIARTAPEIAGPRPEELNAARRALLDHIAGPTRSGNGDRRRRLRWVGGLVAALWPAFTASRLDVLRAIASE